MKHPYEELARRLCCAEMSTTLGITFQHCYNTHMPEGPIPDYWLELAVKVAGDCARMRAQHFQCGNQTAR
jgi:hypothetical protein